MMSGHITSVVPDLIDFPLKVGADSAKQDWKVQVIVAGHENSDYESLGWLWDAIIAFQAPEAGTLVERDSTVKVWLAKEEIGVTANLPPVPLQPDHRKIELDEP